MKTGIWTSFNYGAWNLSFYKLVNLPFTPFLGLNIIVDNKKEHIIKLENNDYCKTVISYNLEEDQFEIDVRNTWKYPVTDDEIGSVLVQFSDWERMDFTNIPSLKELMSRAPRRGTHDI